MSDDSDDCVFCRIVAGDAPARVLAEDDRTVTFLNIAPATEGHSLVVPRTHASDIWDISVDDATAVVAAAKRVAHLLDDRLSPDGLNLVQANRSAGWQTVFHFHVHVIPRWRDDRLQPPWAPTPATAEELDAVFERLRSPSSSVGHERATEHLTWPVGRAASHHRCCVRGAATDDGSSS